MYFYQNLKNMKPNKTLSRLFTVLIVSTVLFACKKKDSVPDNEITDGTGLEITLTWTLNDGTTATTWSDLDLYFIRGDINSEAQINISNIADASANDDSFEKITLTNNLSDGDYSLVVDYFDLSKPGKYSVSFKGTTSGRIYSINDISFTVAENGDVKFPAKITKAGQKFTVTKR